MDENVVQTRPFLTEFLPKSNLLGINRKGEETQHWLEEDFVSKTRQSNYLVWSMKAKVRFVRSLYIVQ